MSSQLRFPRLARLALLGAAGLASAGFSLWTPSLDVASCEASTQDPNGGGQDGAQVAQVPGDEATPVPASRRRQKSARKKGNASDKTKKADPSAKGKSASRKGGAGSSGKLKFSMDIAPILVANCTGCHSGNGNGLKRGKLDLSTFENLQTGTPDHKVIEPGKPDESTLVGRIKGEIEPRMPQGANASLSAAAIAKIERWVKEGATIDSGNDPKKPIASYAASADQVRRAELAKLPVGERDKKTEEVGVARFKQANASKKPEIVRSEHFMIFSEIPKDRATNTLKALETQFSHLKRILGSTAGDWPEKISIYAFSSRNDFVEFIRTVEGRQDVEAEEASSARLSVPQPYLAVIDPQGGRKDEPGSGTPTRRKSRSRRVDERAAEGSADRNLLGLLTESLGSGVVSSAGNPPKWLAYGIGTYLASQVEPRSPYYRQLRQTTLANFQQGWPTRANEALGGSDQMTSDGLHSIAFGLVEYLMSPDLRQAFPSFVGGMLGGTEKLDDTLQRVYRVSREEFINYTGEWVAQRYGNLQ
jgi:Planctomycete cytochrome C